MEDSQEQTNAVKNMYLQFVPHALDEEGVEHCAGSSQGLYF